MYTQKVQFSKPPVNFFLKMRPLVEVYEIKIIGHFACSRFFFFNKQLKANTK